MRVLWLLLCAVLAVPAATRKAPVFSGASALAFTRTIVEFGPRTLDSEAHRKTEQFIAAKAKSFGCDVEQDVWSAQTPAGAVRMANLIARTKSTGERRVVISGHYDTKNIGNPAFVGANDGGSSAGLLLELARVLCSAKTPVPVWLVWFDGEEATGEHWTQQDSLYGSRRLAARWLKDGTAAKIRALINVDMIGDKDLRLMEELGSTDWLRKLVWSTASELGYGRHFPQNPGGVEDDHTPFLKAGIPALDLIDFEYGLFNSWWHTERDTLDKLSADSFTIMGRVLLRTIEKLGMGQVK
ncbi:MAG TPA: M28 family peptidase [Bryobacteraceae bacterium]|nr:M28 family peptidase [Bryobacteraceae bacterium]